MMAEKIEVTPFDVAECLNDEKIAFYRHDGIVMFTA